MFCAFAKETSRHGAPPRLESPGKKGEQRFEATIERTPPVTHNFFDMLSMDSCARGGTVGVRCRDTVYNADNSKFNGQVIISWQGFTTATGATIAPHSTAVRVINGYISVLFDSHHECLRRGQLYRSVPIE